MDWANERYVRVYTRDTVTWKLWTFEARCLFLLILRKVDRAGVLDIGSHDAPMAIAAIVEAPRALVDSALPELCAGDDPAVVLADGALVLPKYLEAQEASQSDAQRSRESRARRRDVARLESPVTKRVDTVTAGHDASRPVTPCLALPSVPDQPPVTTPKPPPGDRRDWNGLWAHFEYCRISATGGQERGLTDRRRRLLKSLVKHAHDDLGCSWEEAEAAVRDYLAWRCSDAKTSEKGRKHITTDAPLRPGQWDFYRRVLEGEVAKARAKQAEENAAEEKREEVTGWLNNVTQGLFSPQKN